jgi:competence protein ComEC
VQVGHHGSKTSSSVDFVAALSAPLALISAGYRNPFGFPDAGVIDRWRASGARVLETADSGAIRVSFGQRGGSLRVRRWRDENRRFWHN